MKTYYTTYKEVRLILSWMHVHTEHANHYTTDEPTIYRTGGEHANHYAIGKVIENKQIRDPGKKR